jgi:hypothetical protein
MFVKVVEDKILLYKKQTDEKAVYCYNIAECTIKNSSILKFVSSSSEE